MQHLYWCYQEEVQYVDLLFIPTGIPVRVTVNKLNFAKNTKGAPLAVFLACYRMAVIWERASRLSFGYEYSFVLLTSLCQV